MPELLIVELDGTQVLLQESVVGLGNFLHRCVYL